jgi:hypothetical protein
MRNLPKVFKPRSLFLNALENLAHFLKLYEYCSSSFPTASKNTNEIETSSNTACDGDGVDTTAYPIALNDNPDEPAENASSSDLEALNSKASILFLRSLVIRGPLY